jgi:hypothetical protein
MMRFSNVITVLSPLRTLWFAGLSFTRIYRRLILFGRTLNQADPEIPLPGSMRVAILAESEIRAFLAFRPDQDASEIRRRLDQDHRCFTVWHEQQIIHAAWAVTGRVHIEYISRDLALAPNEVYVYDAFTAPAFRGRNASPVRALALGEHFRSHGYRRLLTAVRPENKVGFRPLEKVGTRRVGVIGYVGVGRLRWHFCRWRG